MNFNFFGSKRKETLRSLSHALTIDYMNILVCESTGGVLKTFILPCAQMNNPSDSQLDIFAT